MPGACRAVLPYMPPSDSFSRRWMETHRDKGCLCGLTLVNIWFQVRVLELQIAHGPQTSSSVTCHLEICSKRKPLGPNQTGCLRHGRDGARSPCFNKASRCLGCAQVGGSPRSASLNHGDLPRVWVLTAQHWQLCGPLESLL